MPQSPWARVALSVAVVAVVLVAGSSGGALAQPSYDIQPWGTLSPDIEPVDGSWGDISGIALNPVGHIVLLRRGTPPVVELDTSGTVVRTWGTGQILAPHGLYIDRDGFVWITDAPYRGEADTPAGKGRGQQVYKFTPDGRLVMTLGTAGVAGDGPNQFNQPSHVVVAPDGAIFVTDGHTGRLGSNARVVKFASDGTFIKAWGRRGSRPGEFDDPHAIGIDSQGRIFVSDRGNSRIEIFDQDGVFLDEWRQFGGLSGMYIAPDDTIYGANAGDRSPIRGVVIGSAKTGSMTRLIEDWYPEAIVVSADGIIYAGEAATHRSPQPLKRLVLSEPRLTAR